MTPVSQIITDAYRLSNLLAIGVQPTDLQKEEALRYLNRLIKSVFGNEAGDILTSFPVGRKNIERPAGYPWYDTVPSNDWFMPKNMRAMLNVNSPGIRLVLHPNPNDGSRFAATDVSGTLSQFPVEVVGNGRTIQGLFSLTLNVDKFDAEWFYRDDIGDWMKYAPLELEDIFPFPLEFEDYFVTMLALRINPSYGVIMDEQGQMVLSRARTQFRARYTQNIPARSELALIRMPRVAVDRDLWGSAYWLYNPNSMFDKGWPW